METAVKGEGVGFKVSRFQGFKVSRFQGFKVSRFQGFKVSRFQGFKVSRFHCCKVPSRRSGSPFGMKGSDAEFEKQQTQK
jgi:hypothetical protein